MIATNARQKPDDTKNHGTNKSSPTTDQGMTPIAAEAALAYPVVPSADVVKRRIPTATYRLQFNHTFAFRQAAHIVGYFHDRGLSQTDRRIIETAVLSAQRSNPAVNISLFEYIRDVLLLKLPPTSGVNVRLNRTTEHSYTSSHVVVLLPRRWIAGYREYANVGWIDLAFVGRS